MELGLEHRQILICSPWLGFTGLGPPKYWMHNFVAICIVLGRLTALIGSPELETFWVRRLTLGTGEAGRTEGWLGPKGAWEGCHTVERTGTGISLGGRATESSRLLAD